MDSSHNDRSHQQRLFCPSTGGVVVGGSSSLHTPQGTDANPQHDGFVCSKDMTVNWTENKNVDETGCPFHDPNDFERGDENEQQTKNNNDSPVAAAVVSRSASMGGLQCSVSASEVCILSPNEPKCSSKGFSETTMGISNSCPAPNHSMSTLGRISLSRGQEPMLFAQPKQQVASAKSVTTSTTGAEEEKQTIPSHETVVNQLNIWHDSSQDDDNSSRGSSTPASSSAASHLLTTPSEAHGYSQQQQRPHPPLQPPAETSTRDAPSRTHSSMSPRSLHMQASYEPPLVLATIVAALLSNSCDTDDDDEHGLVGVANGNDETAKPSPSSARSGPCLSFTLENDEDIGSTLSTTSGGGGGGDIVAVGSSLTKRRQSSGSIVGPASASPSPANGTGTALPRSGGRTSPQNEHDELKSPFVAPPPLIVAATHFTSSSSQISRQSSSNYASSGSPTVSGTLRARDIPNVMLASSVSSVDDFNESTSSVRSNGGGPLSLGSGGGMVGFSRPRAKSPAISGHTMANLSTMSSTTNGGGDGSRSQPHQQHEKDPPSQQVVTIQVDHVLYDGGGGGGTLSSTPPMAALPTNGESTASAPWDQVAIEDQASPEDGKENDEIADDDNAPNHTTLLAPLSSRPSMPHTGGFVVGSGVSAGWEDDKNTPLTRLNDFDDAMEAICSETFAGDEYDVNDTSSTSTGSSTGSSSSVPFSVSSRTPSPSLSSSGSASPAGFILTAIDTKAQAVVQTLPAHIQQMLCDRCTISVMPKRGRSGFGDVTRIKNTMVHRSLNVITPTLLLKGPSSPVSAFGTSVPPSAQSAMGGDGSGCSSAAAPETNDQYQEERRKRVVASPPSTPPTMATFKR